MDETGDPERARITKSGFKLRSGAVPTQEGSISKTAAGGYDPVPAFCEKEHGGNPKSRQLQRELHPAEKQGRHR